MACRRLLQAMLILIIHNFGKQKLNPILVLYWQDQYFQHEDRKSDLCSHSNNILVLGCVCQTKWCQHPNFTIKSYPTRGDRKWVSSVETSFPIVNRQTVTKDGHLEMLDHGVHHLSEENGGKKQKKLEYSLAGLEYTSDMKSHN